MRGRGGTGRAEHYSNIGEEMKTTVKVGKIKECVLCCHVFSVYSIGASLKKALFFPQPPPLPFASRLSGVLKPSQSTRSSSVHFTPPHLSPLLSSHHSSISSSFPASSALTSSSHPSFLMPVAAAGACSHSVSQSASEGSSIYCSRIPASY